MNRKRPSTDSTQILSDIQAISVTQKLGDLTCGHDFLVELLNVGLSHKEVLEARQRSIAGAAVKAKEGKFLGGTAPLGYDIVNGVYVVNPTEARPEKTASTPSSPMSGT